MNVASLILLFGVDNIRLAMRGEDVRLLTRAVEITSLHDAPDEVLGVINFRGEVVPILNLRKKLHLPERPVSAADFLILVNSNRRSMGLIVSYLEDVISLEGKTADSIEPLFADENPVRMLSIEGKLIQLRELSEFISSAGEVALERALEQQQAKIP